MMVGKNVNSMNLVKFIKPDTIGAELGVWKGDSSALFLNQKVKELHLVDSWSLTAYKTDQQTFDRVIDRYENLVGSKKPEDYESYYEKVYRSVKDRFAIYTNVFIHRMLTSEWFSSLNGKTFDWIYVDADHNEEGCYIDLVNSFNVINDGGLLLGDDYGNKPGVKRAVDRFLAEHKDLPVEFFKNQFKIVKT